MTMEDARTNKDEHTKDLEDDDPKTRFVVKRRPKVRMKKEVQTKPLFTNTRKQFNAVRRRMKKFWRIWVDFKGVKEIRKVAESKSNDATFSVPGFEEISCIEAEVPDIMMTDLDKVRTSCVRCQEQPLSFPTKEQIKAKLIAADKYYGTSRSERVQKKSRDIQDADYYDEDGNLIRPSWRFILERPLVEQYVLMTNYIRKVSVLSELATQNTKVVGERNEEDEVMNEEIDRFTQEHKEGTEQLLKSMRVSPTKRNMEVQTTLKLTDDLQDVASEASLYPDSAASDGSSTIKDFSAITILNSRDLSSPQQSDLDSRVRTEINPCNNAPVRWWESKDLPHTSESIPTSCDSVGKMTSSGSDGTSIPVHSAHGMTELVTASTNRGNPLPDQPRPRRIEIVQENKSKHLKKKVTFSPVVHYYQAPKRIPPLHLISKLEGLVQPPLIEASCSQKTKSHFTQENLFTSGRQSSYQTDTKAEITTVNGHNAKKEGAALPAVLKIEEMQVRDRNLCKKPLTLKQSFEESETSSTSGERIALKTSPARIVQSVASHNSLNSTANLVYPEVPDLDEYFENNDVRMTTHAESNVLKDVKHDVKMSSAEREFPQTGSVTTYTSSVINPPHSDMSNQQMSIYTKDATIAKDNVGCILNLRDFRTAISTTSTKDQDADALLQESHFCADVPCSNPRNKNSSKSTNHDLVNPLDLKENPEGYKPSEVCPPVRIHEKERIHDTPKQQVASDQETSVQFMGNADEGKNEDIHLKTVTVASMVDDKDLLFALDSKTIMEKKAYVKRITAQLNKSPLPSITEFESSLSRIIDMPQISRSIEELKNIFEKKAGALETIESVGTVSRSIDLLSEKQKHQKEAAGRIESVSVECDAGMQNKQISDPGAKINSKNGMSMSVDRGLRPGSNHNLQRGQELSSNKTEDLSSTRNSEEGRQNFPVKTKSLEGKSLQQHPAEANPRAILLRNESQRGLTMAKSTNENLIDQDDKDNALDIVKASQIYSISSTYCSSEDQRIALKIQPITLDNEPERKSQPLLTTRDTRPATQSKIGKEEMCKLYPPISSKASMLHQKADDNTKTQGILSIPNNCEDNHSASRKEFEEEVNSQIQIPESDPKSDSKAEPPQQWLLNVIPKIPINSKLHMNCVKALGKGDPEKPVFKFMKKNPRESGQK